MPNLNANFQIVIFSIGDTKAGTKMGKMQLKNVEDNNILNCILWEEALNRIDPKMFRVGNIIHLKDAKYNEKFNNCLVSDLELVCEAKLGLDEVEINTKYSQIIETINSMKDENIKKLALETIEKYKDKFKKAPAAKLMHHNYIGGLLVHTLECVEYAKLLMPKLTGINSDELLCALILHDIGKIFEYDIDLETGLIEYNEEFKKDWLTHSQFGFTLCMEHNQKRIAKMIAAHHSRADWGALIDLGEKDLEPFYYIVHHIDDLSAKFGKISINNL